MKSTSVHRASRLAPSQSFLNGAFWEKCHPFTYKQEYIHFFYGLDSRNKEEMGKLCLKMCWSKRMKKQKSTRFGGPALAVEFRVFFSLHSSWKQSFNLTSVTQTRQASTYLYNINVWWSWQWASQISNCRKRNWPRTSAATPKSSLQCLCSGPISCHGCSQPMIEHGRDANADLFLELLVSFTGRLCFNDSLVALSKSLWNHTEA